MHRDFRLHRTDAKRVIYRSAFVLVAVAAVTMAVASSAFAAASSTVGFSFICSGRSLPNTCPQSTYTKGGLNIHTHTNYTNPGSADGGKTKRIQIFFDNDFRFNPGVTPRCDPSLLFNQNMASAMANCGSSLIGTGTGQAATGTGTLNACMLVFNGTNDGNGDPRVILYFRAPISNPSTDCANPASNTLGSTTIVLPGSLRPVPIGDYGRELDIPNIHNVVLPVSDLNFNIVKTTFSSGYVQARCGDANRVWNLTTRFTYNNNTTQTVNSTRTCRVG
jgi:hypothetical protein